MSVDPKQPPALRHLFGEARLGVDWIAGRSKFDRLARLWPGDGRHVMVIPGLLSGDASTAMLRRLLNRAGYVSHGWGLGHNMPPTSDLLERFDYQVKVLAGGEQMTLIGWSLGGIIARAYANQHPSRVSAVLTLGAPFSGNPRANRAWRVYELFADHTVDHPPAQIDYGQKPPVPTVAIWSARDGIIPPHAARGREGESDYTVEIECGHFAMSCAPDAMEAVLRVLAERG